MGAFVLFAKACSAGAGGEIFGLPGVPNSGLPTWYKYLECDNLNNVVNFSLEQVWLVVAAVLEMMLRISVLVAVFFIIWGGFQMLLSSGNPERVSGARTTILNAVVGLVIAVVATGVVTLIASNFGA